MYFITVFTQYIITERGIPDIGSSRTVGFYRSKKDAIDTVLENCCDLYEFVYT